MQLIFFNHSFSWVLLHVSCVTQRYDKSRRYFQEWIVEELDLVERLSKLRPLAPALPRKVFSPLCWTHFGIILGSENWKTFSYKDQALPSPSSASHLYILSLSYSAKLYLFFRGRGFKSWSYLWTLLKMKVRAFFPGKSKLSFLAKAWIFLSLFLFYWICFILYLFANGF